MLTQFLDLDSEEHGVNIQFTFDNAEEGAVGVLTFYAVKNHV